MDEEGKYKVTSVVFRMLEFDLGTTDRPIDRSIENYVIGGVD